jgi:methyl-accepting chemotaxis protein
MSTSIIFSLVGLVVGFGLGLFVKGNGASGTSKLSEGLKEVAKGNYAYNFKKALGTSGAMGDIGKDLDTILVAVNSMIAKMKVSGEQNAYESEKVFEQIEVSTQVSGNINGAVEKIAYGSTEQKGHIDNISTNSEKMANLATTIQEKCSKNHDLAQGVNHGMNDVSAYVERLMDGIEASGDVAQTSAQKIHALKSRVEEISNFILVVTSISEQTNLLALNASIESARAGEAGRGFAVVAEEVRKLAEESKAASEDIVKIVNEVMLETEQVVEQIDDNSKTVAGNLDMVSEVKNLIQSTKEKIDTMEADIATISVITDEQAKEAEIIAKSIEDVAVLSNNIASESQEVYAACEEQSASMEEMMTSCEILSKTSTESLNKVKEFSKGISMGQEAHNRIRTLLEKLVATSKTEDLLSMDYSSHKSKIDQLINSDPAFTVVYSASSATDNLHYINLDLTMDTVSFREWYSQPMKTKNTYISEIYVPLGSDSPCITISAPIIRTGEVVGVLGADINLTDIE